MVCKIDFGLTYFRISQYDTLSLSQNVHINSKITVSKIDFNQKYLSQFIATKNIKIECDFFGRNLQYVVLNVWISTTTGCQFLLCFGTLYLLALFVGDLILSHLFGVRVAFDMNVERKVNKTLNAQAFAFSVYSCVNINV